MAQRIKALSGGKPHPSWKGWRNFLKSCEKRDEADGVIFYGSVNCNYIVWPNGEMVQNYGYHGKALMNKIRESGADKVLEEIKQKIQEIKCLLNK